MGWRSDIARGMYGNLPRALMDRSLFPLIEATCSQVCLPCPRCGAGLPCLPCLDISFIDVRDKHATELRARTGLRLPIYPQQCSTCGCAITYDETEP